MYCVVPENNQTSLIESLFSETPYITMEIPINLHAFLLIFLVFEPIAPLLPKELPIPSVEEAGGGGGTLIHYLYRYVPPNGVMILKPPL